MIKTILLDPPTNFVIAHILMWAARNEVSKQSKTWTFPMLATCAYFLLVFIPITGWFVFNYTGWDTVYLRPESWFTTPRIALILVTYFGGGFAGALIAQSLLQLGRVRDFWISLSVGVLVLAAVWIVTWEDYFLLGTYQEWLNGQAKHIQEDPVFMARLNGSGAMLALPAIALLFVFRRRGSRVN